jgi:hypothetical protein
VREVLRKKTRVHWSYVQVKAVLLHFGVETALLFDLHLPLDFVFDLDLWLDLQAEPEAVECESLFMIRCA